MGSHFSIISIEKSSMIEKNDMIKQVQQGENFMKLISTKFGEQYCNCREGVYTNLDTFIDAFSLYRDMYIDKPKPTVYLYFSYTRVFDIAAINSKDFNEDIAPYITEINDRKYIINLEIPKFPPRTTIKL